MKPTNNFKNTIQSYLEALSKTDVLFAVSFNKQGKNIDDCITYICNWVKGGDCNGFTDAEIFEQAVYYYTADEIEIGKPMNCRVVINHVVELSDEEKREAKQAAIEKYVSDERDKLKIKTIQKKAEIVETPSLF